MNAAFRVLTTLSTTGVEAVLSDASQVVGTVRVQDTFWPTGWWSTLVSRQAGAGRSAVLDTTLRVRAARARLAWILVARRIS